MSSRREFITLLGGTVAWPFAARAQQQTAPPVIGLLQQGGPSSYDLRGFHQGLKDAGFVEGQNVAVEYRWADDDPHRLPELASDLVRRQVRAIAVIASILATRAAKTATNTIPIVFGFGGDPVELGLVASLNRPGGNVTGITSQANELVGKQVGLLHELLPQAAHFGMLSNPTSLIHEVRTKDAQIAAAAIGRTMEILTASTHDEINAVFARVAEEKRVQGLLVANDPLYIGQRVQLATLAARYAVPAIYPFREMAAAGGLLSYGPDLAERDRDAGRYVGRILKGESPTDLPVQRASKFELVINLKIAKTLGLTVATSMQMLADEVIE
jgi:ABC-type uncharacterized transport system substrate-binding protein